MANVRINTRSIDFPFRVWNNRRGMKAGIATATGISIALKYEPLPNHHKLSDRVRGQCVLSGKLDTSPSPEDFREFPIENTQYDELESGQFNQYEMRIDLTNWPNKREFLIEDYLSKIYLVVEVDE